MKSQKKIRVEKTVTHKFSRVDLIDLLNVVGYDVPQNAEVFVEVPTGGDWSGMDLDVGTDAPLIVRYVTIEETDADN